MRTAALVEATGKLCLEIADQTVKRMNLGGDLLIIDFGHPIGGLDRTMRRTNRQDHMIGDRPNGVRELALDHEDISGAGGENLTAARDGSFAANHDEEMIAGMGVRYESVAGGKPDDVGAEQSV